MCWGKNNFVQYIYMIKRLPGILPRPRQAVEKALREGLGWVYSVPDAWLRRVARFPLYQANRAVKMLSDHNEGCAYLLRGSSSLDGQPLSIVMVGTWNIVQQDGLPYYQRLLFGKELVQRENLGPVARYQYREKAE